MTKIQVDRTPECIQILYDLYIDALSFSHRGKTLAPATHSQYHTYYLVFKDLEEIIHRKHAKAQREHDKIKQLRCQYCEVPIDYFRSPGPLHNPPPRPRSRSRSRSPPSPAYSPTSRRSSSSSSSFDWVPSPPTRRPSSTHVALLQAKDVDDLELQHLDIRKILKSTDKAMTRELQLGSSA